jgi:uncharacterized protein (DUF1800 family)
MNSESIRLTRKVGFGLRPEDAVPDDVVGWALDQLDTQPQALGVAGVPLPGMGQSMAQPKIVPWPAERIWSLTDTVDRFRAFEKGRAIADKKYAGDGAKYAAYMNEVMAKNINLAFDQLRRAHQPVYGSRPVFERFTYFWANHFTAGASNHADIVGAHFIESAIGANLTRSFADLLYDVTTHPAMQNYLDNSESMGPNSRLGKQFKRQGKYGDINENLARELLELHTLSPAGGYVQDDIVNVAKILTGHGYNIAVRDDFKGKERWKTFFPDWHEPGSKTALGGSYPEGPEALRQLTDYLAQHPSTIRFLCGKLARHFIADEPTSDDTDYLIKAWAEGSGNLQLLHKAVIVRAVARREARKFQMPEVWLYQMLRLSGANLFAGWDQTQSATEPLFPDSYNRAPADLLAELGQSYWVTRQPNGYSDIRADWISPEHLDRRLRFSQLAFTAGVPALGAEKLVERLGVDSATQTLVSGGKTDVEKFVLLFCSPELMEA